ncbi:putative phage tail protein [Clostridium aceticum]|uniref:Putative phage tail protein n=1 Tax=Clostridium aceticum TaxID=84022 RepID=A0A0G3WAX8_9CLOT|nr:phage tail protein I [Clostridium aceticum]AKL95025.1 putative phage tail protein [Clostridium aceticum]
MIDVYNIKLIDILPPNFKNDPDILAASKALDDEFVLLIDEVKNCILLPRIDELGSELIDLLAWELHVDFYDTSLSLEKRRQLVKNSLKWHKRKGTPSAVEEVITTAFDNAWIEEWLEYGGEPYHFRIKTEALIEDAQKLNQIFKAINSVKNTRSWLDSIAIERANRLGVNLGTVTQQSIKITIVSKLLKDTYNLESNIFLGAVCTQTNEITIYTEVN